MSNKLSDIVREAQYVLDKLENGKTYPSSYVVERFQKAAEKHSKDQLIGNMRDVLVKVASNRAYIHQKEIEKLYDEMYGLSGGRTAFRTELEDLLPEGRHFKEATRRGSDRRTMNEAEPLEMKVNKELSDAFSVLFSLGGNSSFTAYKQSEIKDVQKVVINKLSNLGYTPRNIDIVKQNEHFILVASTHDTASGNKVSTLIPVQVMDGIVKDPSLIIVGNEAVELNGRNLFAAIKEQEKMHKEGSARKVLASRDDGLADIQFDKAVLPKSLEKYADLENTLIAAASNFSVREINMATAMLGAEFASFGSKNSDVRVGKSDSNGIIFDVHVPTKAGSATVHVPVEIINGSPLLPRKFAAKSSDNDEILYDFSQSGFNQFVSNVTQDSQCVAFSRQNGPMSKMSYNQLIDSIIEGVASKDFRVAEDALKVIEAKFGSDKFLTAFDKFSNLLKHSSESNTRNKLIKEAYERGELIQVPSSVELYSTKLGLPISRIDFDEKGRMYPKGRAAKADNEPEGTFINTSKIILT